MEKIHKTNKGIDRHQFDVATVQWETMEYTHHEKPLSWFIGAGLIVFGLVLYGLMTNGWTFSIAVIVFAGTYYLLHHTPPRQITVKISRAGIKIGAHAIPYGQMNGFWIVYKPPYVARLYLRMQMRLSPDLIIDISQADISEVKEELEKHIKEIKGKDEPFGDTLVRLLRL